MKKKLLSVILAVAVAFTFSFAMVGTASATTYFPSEKTVWASDYSSVEVYNDSGSYVGTYSADLYAVDNDGKKIGEQDAAAWNGLLEADAKVSSGDSSYNEYVAYFYDLTDTYIPNDVISPVYDSAAKFDTAWGTDKVKTLTGVTFKVPTSLKNDAGAFVDDEGAKITVVKATAFNNYAAKANKPAEYDPESYAAQTVTVKPVFTKTVAAADGTLANPFVKANTSIADKSVKISASYPEATFVIDEESAYSGQPTLTKDGEDADNYYYDGKEHSVVLLGEGLSATYQLYDYDTFTYGAKSATAPTFKDVTDSAEPLKFKATIKNSVNSAEETGVYTINVKQSYANYGFAPSNQEGTAAAYTVKEGTEYNLADFTEITGERRDNHPQSTDLNDETEAGDAAIEANKAELTAYFNDYYDLSEEADKYTENQKNLKIAQKELTKAQKKELDAKYEDAAICNNFFLGTGITNATLTIEEIANVKANEVTFTTYVAKKTYNANKSKKLAKTKKFSVVAEAKSGVAPTYKLIDAPSKASIDSETGKITIKKGLKKGTYKFKVKAYVDAGNGYLGAYETQAIKVVIK